MKIRKINFNGEIFPTWDIEVPEVHHYNCEGVVSHNSSIVSNATNGIEPPRDFLSKKKNKKGVLVQIVPNYFQLKNFYTLAWEMESNKNYLDIVAIMQKFFDQGISVNTYYDSKRYPEGKIPLEEVVEDIFYHYKMGGKSMYYHNTNDGNEDSLNEKAIELETVEPIVIDDEYCEACAI